MKTYVWEYLNSTVASLFKNRGGGGIESIQPGTGVNIDDSDPSNPIINVVGDGSSSLQDVTDLGNSTTNDIGFEAGAGIEFIANAARVREGTNNAGLGGNKGVALICSNAYELKWEAGRLYYMEQDGFTIREVTHNFTLTPTENDDVNKGFVTGSKWVLDDGTVFLCIDNSSGNATWVPTLPPCIPLRGTAYTDNGQVVGNIEIDVAAGGQITLRFSNGDIIGLGADYNGYSAISFYDALGNQTFYAYIRAGDLYFKNIDTGNQVQGITNEITNLNSFAIFGSQIQVENQGHNGAIRILNYSGDSIYWGSFGSGRVGWKKLTQYYAKYSAFITQTSTNAPVEAWVIESDFNNIGCPTTYGWSYLGVGSYALTVNGTVALDRWVLDSQKTIVRITNGQNQNVVYSHALNNLVGNIIRIDIKTTNPQTGNLTNGLMEKTLIEVEFYV